ncbi:hypothetical protein MHU86_3280 [Fragilaria crotonensis]|nr:hypothetical protein MHU86_3280 [Fragilaria crotonensis]
MSSLFITQTNKFTVWSAPTIDEVHATVKKAPVDKAAAPCPYTDLTHFIAFGELHELGVYLAAQNLFDFAFTEFAAAGRRHADSIDLQTRTGHGENIDWPAGFGFFECRANRGSAEYWRHNDNAARLPELVAFVDRLPFFESTGKVTIVLSQAGDRGAEHVDHKFDDLVSEFVWIRTGVGPRKEFFIRDACGTKCYVDDKKSEGEGICLWFDDHHTHSIDPIIEACYSIRIDGVFNDAFRNYICNVGTFCRQSAGGATSGSLSEVLRSQRTSEPLSIAASQSIKAATDKAHAACNYRIMTATLRSELVNAHERIAELEGMLKATSLK